MGSIDVGHTTRIEALLILVSHGFHQFNKPDFYRISNDFFGHLDRIKYFRTHRPSELSDTQRRRQYVKSIIMNVKSVCIVTAILFILNQAAFGQHNRLNTSNSIGWYNYFGTFKVTKKIGIHTEYQCRRNNILTDWQQSLLRIGVNYNVNTRIMFRVGYAWIETFPYGEYPINGYGKDFTEHRIFEMVQLSHKEGIVDFSHRFMLEQRFIGKYSSPNQTTEDNFQLLNRLRYMIKLQLPFKGTEIKDHTPYLSLYDEIFIGFGENVNVNVFDQNRIGVLLGYRFNKNLRIEGGYLNQTLQYGRQINSKPVFQYNHGLIINANLTIDLTKKL